MFASVASGLDEAPYLFFRLIGAKEARVCNRSSLQPRSPPLTTRFQIGLMLLYITFIRSRNRALMMLTVIGRLRYPRSFASGCEFFGI
jgi:hypothetical protein